MNIKPTRKLFVIIQPLQYLQALELLREDDVCVLIALWANPQSQLHNLVNESDWSKVIWIEYSGSVIDIIKNRIQIRTTLTNLGVFDEVIVSAYYNEFMNLIVNGNSNSKVMLLEDGNATLFIDTYKYYESFKFKLKYLACKLIGFNICPITNVTLFTLSRLDDIKMPAIASNVVINDFRKLRTEIESYACDNSIYFISSSFINVGMLLKTDYISFLSNLALKTPNAPFNIMLHRFDDRNDFLALLELGNVNIHKFEGPIELYFKQQQINPMKVISSGSGATETLRLIYGLDVEIVMPDIQLFHPDYRENVELLVKHLKESYKVEFLEKGE